MVSERSEDTERSEKTGPPSRRSLLSTIASIGTATGLAGCSDVLGGDREYRATPVVLDAAGQRRLGLEELHIDEQVETVSPSEEVGEVEMTSYQAVHRRTADHDPPVRFDSPDPAARAVGTLAMPSPEVLGETLNPLATEPFEELLVGERGRQLVQETGAVDSPDFTWEQEPTRIDTEPVELLGTEEEAQQFLGIAVEEGTQGSGAGRTTQNRPTTMVMNLVRVQPGEDVVMLGEFIWRTTPPSPVDVDGPCVDGFCQFLEPEQLDMWRRFKESVIRGAIECDIDTMGASGTTGPDRVELCPVGGSSGDSAPIPTVSVTNARLVQHVEKTVVKEPGESPIHTEDDPDLVEGEKTAVVFDLESIEHLDEMDDPLEIELDLRQSPRRLESIGTFQLSESELRDIDGSGEHTISVLHDNGDNPVFDLDTYDDDDDYDPYADKAQVVLSEANVEFEQFSVIVDKDDGIVGQSREVVEVDPLRVGFVALIDPEDGDRYGNNNGWPRNVLRSFDSATEYLQRSFPGDVVTYLQALTVIKGGSEQTGLFKRNCEDTCVIFKDMKFSKNYLNNQATDSSFPKRGTLRLDGLNRSTVENDIRNNGFDVVVVIVPGVATQNDGASDYYDYFDKGASGLAFDDPAAAVSAEGVAPRGDDQSFSKTVAHEVGHYFQDDYRGPSGDPMAQRRDDDDDDNQPTGPSGNPLDPAHARNQNSNRVAGDDAPGVISTAYDLVDGFANLQRFDNPNGSFSVDGPSSSAISIGQVESYMSYTPRPAQAWADARIHQQLIDSQWNASGTSGSGNPGYMLSATGGVGEDGKILYGEVVAMGGIEEYTDREEAPVLVELLADDGRVLESARVPLEISPTHDGRGRTGESVRAPSFSLPFHEEGVEVRTSFDRPSFMNPIVRSVGDAVGRVPTEGIRGDREPETARESVDEELDAVAAAMEAGDYERAAERMGGPVRDRILSVVGEYEAALNEPTVEELMALVDEMVRRLQVVAETTA